MRGDGRAVADIAASVADGAPVDWGSIEAGLPAPDRLLVRHLRLVESISSLYRTIHSGAEEDLEESPPVSEGPLWGSLALRDRIGSGSSCDVYRAWDSSLHRDVALKLLNEDGPGNRDAHVRILQEARRLARVRHQHVVQVYGAEEHDGRVGLWMELVEGESLEQIVRTRGRFGAAEASVIGQQLCAALAAVHGAGLLHRDVKAQNVVREGGGRIVLMDFGTGEELRTNKGTNRLVGTPLYLAPEIFRDHPASVQSDIYSLGVLLFHLVTGEFPITAGSMEGLARAHAQSSMRRLRDARPELPDGFLGVVERALDPDPKRRYRTAGEMELALRSWPESPPDRVKKTGALRSAGRWSFAAAAAVLGVLTLALIVWTRQTSAPATAAAIKRVVIAPMTTIDSSGAPPFFAEGLTDQLIATLGQIHSLRVIAAHGSANGSYGGGSGRGGDAVLHTTLLAAGATGVLTPRVRVNARLVAPGTGTVLWAQTFERPLGDTFGLQAAVAREIAAAVDAAVTSDEHARISRSRQTTPQAEAAFLEGLAYIESYGPDYAQRALNAFKRAIDLDPGHAAARAGAARAYFALGNWSVLTPSVARPLALAEAQNAIALEDSLPDAHATLAGIAFYFDWDLQGAEARYLRSLNLNPSYRYGRIQYAHMLAAASRTSEAVVQAELAVDLEPTSAQAHRNHGLVLYYHRDFDAAERAVRRSLDFEPNAPAAWILLGRIAEAKGELDKARGYTDRAADLMQSVPTMLRIQQVRLRALSGQRAEAVSELTRVRSEATARGAPWPSHFDGYVSLALGEIDASLNYFEEAIRHRESNLLWLAVDPRLDPARGRPRFKSMIRSLGIRGSSGP